MRSTAALALLAFIVTPSVLAAASSAPLPEGALQYQSDQLNWQPGPPSLPAGSKLVVLEGDPRQPGLFTMRVRVPAGASLAPHTHPRHERVTVLSGTIGLAFGSSNDPTLLRVLRAGDYYVNPPGAPHYLRFAEESILQITTEGPWGLDYLKP